MKLKNYTSSVPANRSIDYIEKALVDMGAKSTIKEHGSDKKLTGIRFLIDVNNTTIVFVLPANVEAVFKTFWKEVKRPTPETRERLMQQAERTAWKLIHDWVLVQHSMIRLQQAEFLQIFLPYALMPNGQTTYQAIKEGGFKQLQQTN